MNKRTREEHISNLETIGCDGWTVTTEAYKSLQYAIQVLKQEPCEDAISREETIIQISEKGLEKKILDDRGHVGILFEDLFPIINELPPVTPIVETAEWIKGIRKIPYPPDVAGEYSEDTYDEEYTYCSKCKYEPDDESFTWNTNYCPNCGRNMVK